MEKKVTIINETGLHARPASLFVKKASEFKSSVELVHDGEKVNAKSIMGIMKLGLAKGTEIIIETHGEDEEQALNEMVQLVENGFGEK
ncbi:HPr family phosphocarrier protein [Peptostreptococcus porci]|uniref:HPr family phosphocarrier protein n=1 Tax=Peptostreptococcus porci TaxID=2652282 RepID=UPI0023F17664|nr:HPr family phosphocarrier protein [Peptostreptococcus porci]MDD7182206.1 HPr family phosphocarrier protein [Peptostreptococcus porci]MDY5964605.1 HPr family phosphocarrier protein [Peptostreptococcus porci]